MVVFFYSKPCVFLNPTSASPNPGNASVRGADTFPHCTVLRPAYAKASEWHSKATEGQAYAWVRGNRQRHRDVLLLLLYIHNQGEGSRIVLRRINRVQENTEQVTGLHPNVRGDFSHIRGNVSYITGDVTGIRGDVTHILGDVSDIWGNVTAIRGNVTHIRGDVSAITGDVSDIWGNVSAIRGNVTGIWGDVSRIWGDVTGISGNVTGVEGDASGLSGSVLELLAEAEAPAGAP
jgi:hypothetical protein